MVRNNCVAGILGPHNLDDPRASDVAENKIKVPCKYLCNSGKLPKSRYTLETPEFSAKLEAMPKFDANLTWLFSDLPLLDRIDAAAGSGFHGVEILFPYEEEAATLAGRLQDSRLDCVLINLPPGNWSGGERGTACHPGREEEFQASVQEAVSYARELKTPRLHAMAGIVPQGTDRKNAWATYIQNLKWAARYARDHQIEILIEPINTRDMPGYLLNYQEDAARAIAEADEENLKMQMDLYHLQVMEGDIATKLKRYIGLCGHIQIAGVPDRGEPDQGEVRYEYVFNLLDELGYRGWVGCEYRPKADTRAGLGWMKRWIA